MAKKSTYEGLQKSVRTMKTPAIETWLNQYPDKRATVAIDIPEFTCICPKTGLPDFATLLIEYVPFRRCAELKSLKEYMTSFRSVGIFHEHLTNRVLDDFVAACRPRWARITTRFNPRGGITTTVTREYGRRS
ncbi:MAG: preQ(1) synthase [Deltaproteobacteria bacterium]